MYAAREGRACDNCHLGPNRWENPRLAERKCTLSCQSCHVDPAGGGLRNAVGRFYGRSTLPMIATSPRPTQDWDREFVRPLYRLDRATSYTDSLPRGPVNQIESLAPAYAPHDRWARGRPLGGPSSFDLFQGREGVLRSNPLLRVGWDLRFAALLASGTLVFPMQADLDAALQPVEHLTVLADLGARGHSSAWSKTFDDPSTPYLRQAFVLLHEAPFLSYLKAGRFTPAFGLRLDDHTAQTRRVFEVDDALPDARVTGVEAGINPNYPYGSVAWFESAGRGRAPAAFDVFDVDPGWGATLNLGYRERGFAAGTSALLRRRPLAEGGDATSFALFGVFNPWFYSRRLPVTWQAELDAGDFRRESGRRARRTAFYQEFDWLAGNGVNLLVAQDWSDPDREVREDQSYRLSAGVQLCPVPGFTIDARLRALVPAGERSGGDFFVHLHLWN
jgi:hypothetical protein